MTEDLPSFDPDHETPQAPPAPPKKPRRKPAKWAKKLAVVKASPKKKSRRGRPPGKAGRKTKRKPYRQARVVAAKLLSDERSSVSTITSAYDRINSILSELSPVERGAMLEALK
jgi:hypothetical protein